MFRGKDLSEARFPPQHESERITGNPDDKIEYSEKGVDFLSGSGMGHEGFLSKPSKFENQRGSTQELTLSYLCDANSKFNFHHKGKEVAVDNSNHQGRWVERDFLQLNVIGADSSKREVEDDEEFERHTRGKTPKLEPLSLSLGLPDMSFSLTASNAVHNADPRPPIRPKPSRSIQSLAPSNNNTQTTCSNDFTAVSLSYSNSHVFSHNPSCSLTMNSTENYENSFGRETDHQIWNCGEGTNGSVHSRFKPIGDGVSLSNHGGSIFPLIQGSRLINMESCNNSLQMATSSDNISFFPSELPAKPKNDNHWENSRGRGSENYNGGSRVRKLSGPERIVREIVFESIPLMCQTIQELPIEMLQLTKEYLSNVITENKEELSSLQNRLEKRSDLNNETLSKANRTQLDILVAVKTGLVIFLSGKNPLPPSELVEIFLLARCRNLNCKSVLPVDDCDCKICSSNKGFCSSCMCPICLNFDCASNTCSWVGCDVCSHWCHAACGIKKNLIKPGPSLNGAKGTTELQFHCIGCGHASEMFGFVKDVFVCCSKDWDIDTLIKELDCVRKIFESSDDFKGKKLHFNAGELLSKIDAKMISPSDARNLIIQFFNYTDDMLEIPSFDASSKDLKISQPNHRNDAVPVPPKYSTYNHTISSSTLHQNPLSLAHHESNPKTENDYRSQNLPQKDGFDNLESIVRIKEAEARMFQGRADEARREAEAYKRMVRARSEKLDEEYAEKLAKLCLQDTEERRRKKMEELKILENSQCDYYKMKMRMQAEIAGLLERMESAKHQCV